MDKYIRIQLHCTYIHVLYFNHVPPSPDCTVPLLFQIALEPYSPSVFLSCGEDGSVLEVDLREDAKRNK